MISLDATFNRRLVRAAVGELLRLDLPEDTAAGNRWALPDPIPEQLRLVMDKTASDQRVTYAAGNRRLEFRVVAVGSFSLSLSNEHCWQKPPPSFDLLVEAYQADHEEPVSTNS
jgi:hypothetical protein